MQAHIATAAPRPQTPLDRSLPSTEWRAFYRAAFPTTASRQAALDQKFDRRHGPGWKRVALEDLDEGLHDLLRQQLSEAFTVSSPRWLTGGASKLQMAFELSVGQGCPVSMLLRMDPPETLNATNKHTEFELMRASGNIIPVPSVHWLDADARWLPEPALVMSICEGVAKPTTGEAGAITGLGTRFGADLREQLGSEFVRNLARLHAFEPAPIASANVVIPEAGSAEAALGRLNFERQLWELDRPCADPLMSVAAGWLERESAGTRSRVDRPRRLSQRQLLVPRGHAHDNGHARLGIRVRRGSPRGSGVRTA